MLLCILQLEVGGERGQQVPDDGDTPRLAQELASTGVRQHPHVSVVGREPKQSENIILLNIRHCFTCMSNKLKLPCLKGIYLIFLATFYFVNKNEILHNTETYCKIC